MTAAPDPFAFPACLERFTGETQDFAPDPVYLALLARYAPASTEDAAIGGTKPEHSAPQPASNVIPFRPRRPMQGKPL
jgi:hypothetical protein